MADEVHDKSRSRRGSPEDRLRIVLEFAAACPWWMDPSTGRLDWEADPASVLGWPSDQTRDWSGLIDLADPADRASLEKLRQVNGDASTVRFRIRQPGGGWRWICMHGRRLGDDGSIYGVIVDETDRQTDLRRSRMLLAELQHRIKNMVAIIRSIAHRTRETSVDLDEFAAHFEGRLASYSRTHSALARTDRGDVDLEEIVREELRLNAPPDNEPWTIAGPTVRLRQRPAELLALAVHELTTNAVKYGALSSPGGRIDIVWRLSDDGSRLRLDWTETTAEAIGRPEKSGFGRETIEQALPYQLGADTELIFEPTGLRCRIEVAFDRAPVR